MKNLPQRRARFMRMRIAFLSLLLFVGAGSVAHRAFELQVSRSSELRSMAEEQYLRDMHLSPKRGTVFDRNGAELAVSVDVDSVWANPRQLRRSGGDSRQVARALARLLDVDPERIERRLRSQRYFVWIKRRVSFEEAKAVLALELPGVALTSEARRYYPNRSLAAHVLGFANVDGKGIEGLELELDERLRGAADPVPAIRDRRGLIVFSEQLLDDRAAQGDDVVLTIDRTIQHVAERELELAVRTFEAQGGSVVVMDPRTGEVLAMANYPTYNPNEPGSAPPAHRRNRAVTDLFEPGSTVKQFTVASALASGAIRADQRIDCQNGEMEVAEYVIHDTHKWELLSPAEILVQSSNIGTAKIGMALGRKRLYRALRDFGFGQETGVLLPGETAGKLSHFKRWYDMDAATISFGQGMSSTTLQLATAMSALANKGRLMKPILVKRVLDADGNVLEDHTPHTRRQVVPAATARLVADMLTGVTGEDGTGPDAAIDGHLVAGKTGTAQKADYRRGGYAKDKWTSSFVGFAPAQRPRLVTAVVIDEPVIAHYGGTVAGPTFRRITEAGLRHLGVPTRAHGTALSDSRKGRGKPRKAKPSDDGRDANTAAEAAPAQDDKAAPPARPLREHERLVPELAGMTARAALVRARKWQLDLAVHGTGVVVSQRPAAGSLVAEGARIEARLAPPDHTYDPRRGEREPALPPTAQGAGPPLAANAKVEGHDG